jgi:uncharacterized membrane protein (UPF0127 family)
MIMDKDLLIMKSGVIQNLNSNRIIADCVWKADDFISRLRGLQGRPALKPGEGLWLMPCQQIHMFGMRFPISVWFLDKYGTVCDIIDEIRPYRISHRQKEAVSVLEFPVDWANITDTRIGDKLKWRNLRDIRRAI